MSYLQKLSWRRLKKLEAEFGQDVVKPNISDRSRAYIELQLREIETEINRRSHVFIRRRG